MSLAPAGTVTPPMVVSQVVMRRHAGTLVS